MVEINGLIQVSALHMYCVIRYVSSQYVVYSVYRESVFCMNLVFITVGCSFTLGMEFLVCIGPVIVLCVGMLDVGFVLCGVSVV